MDQSLHFITVSTADLEAARSFYITGLGWHPLLDVPGEIIFFQVAPGLALGLFDSEKFNADIATGADNSSVSGLTLSHNVDSPVGVSEVVDAMERAGGTVLKAPQDGAFGGIHHPHVQDPNGIIWEIAHNPSWRIANDGTVAIG
ncbi:MAG TPA: VOC family protein [Gemmatimonadales bacterium]|nr:VOC family protein [Gemmatimonadales bacterium]